MADELKTIKFQMMLGETEANTIDDWSFARRIRSRAEAIRRLVQIGMHAEREVDDVAASSILVMQHIKSLVDKMVQADANGDSADARLSHYEDFARAVFPLMFLVTLQSNGLSELLTLLRQGEDVTDAMAAADAKRADLDARAVEIREKFEKYQDGDDGPEAVPPV